MSAWAAARTAAARLSAAGVEDAAFEAEFLARTASQMSRARYFAGGAFDSGSASRFEDALARRLRREPAAYIAGQREFCGRSFAVGPGVLVPRPETELLVEAALAELAEMPTGAHVLDVGTGSGCIAISIALDAPGARVTGIEPCAAALRVARRNAARLDAPVSFARASLLSAVARADVVLANLPYIPTADIGALQPEVRDWEPRRALDGGRDGLTLIRPLIADCAARLRPRLLALEVGVGQAGPVAAFARALGATASVTRDLAGIERVVCARWA